MKIHKIGLCFHLAYTMVISIYIRAAYLKQDYGLGKPFQHSLLCILGVLLIYPAIYDGAQMLKQGRKYFTQFWNYVDILHILGGYVNIIAQMNNSVQMKSTVLQAVIVISILFKLFFFMRIYVRFSIITTMLL